MINRAKKELLFIFTMILLTGTVLLCTLLYTHAYADGKSVITLNTANKTVNAGEKFQLKAEITDEEEKSREVIWKSSKPKTASVTKNGVVKAKKKGIAKITAVLKGTDYKAVCVVTVQKKDSASKHYSGAGIAFDHPAGLKVKNISGEDGSRMEFKDKNGKPVFWYEQGEEWRVDMDLEQSAYQKLLEEKFGSVQINAYELINVNGISMRKAVFQQTDGNKNQKITEYLMVSQYAYFDFYFIDCGEDFTDSLVKSIQF